MTAIPQCSKSAPLRVATPSYKTSTNDPHLWLDPRNAIWIAATAVKVLAAEDPDYITRYKVNGDRTKSRLTALDSRIAKILAPLKGVP